MKTLRNLLLFAAALLIVPAAQAAEYEPIGYGGAKVPLAPIMAPYRIGKSVRYQVVTVRMVLDVGLNERPACFMIPVVHEKILLYLYKAMPQPADLEGQRKDVFLKALLDVATDATDRGLFSGI